jgi:O-antigen/teichoic acid export membrane protein
MDVRTRNAFLLGAASNWLAFAATLAVSFGLTPVLIGSLGRPRYDVWCVVESILAYFTLLDFGVAACLVRYVARHHAIQDRHGLNRMASASLAVFLVAAILAGLLGAPILFLLSSTLEEKAGTPGDVLPFMVLMLVNLAATLPLSVFPSILDGLERFTAKSLTRLLFLAVRTVGIVFAIQTQPALFPLAVVYTSVNFLEHAVLAGLCYRFLPGLSFSYRHVDRESFHLIRGYSTDAFLAMLAGRITVQTGAILVGIYLPAGQVTFFATAARLVEYAKTLLRTITTTLTPGISALEARNDTEAIRRLFLTASRWLLYLALPVNLGLWWFGVPFFQRWVGEEFVHGSYPAMAILATTVAIGVAQSVAARVLYGIGCLRLFARLALLEAALNFALSWLLIRWLGVAGVAIGIALPNLLFCGVVIALTLQQLQLPPVRYFRESWQPPLLALLIPLVIWSLTGRSEPQWMVIAFDLTAGLLPYAGLVGWREFARRDRCKKSNHPGSVNYSETWALWHFRQRMTQRLAATFRRPCRGFPPPARPPRTSPSTLR